MVQKQVIRVYPFSYNKILGGGSIGTYSNSLSGYTIVNFKEKKLKKKKFFLIPTEEYRRNKDKYITIMSGKVIAKPKDKNYYISISKKEYINNKEKYFSIVYNASIITTNVLKNYLKNNWANKFWEIIEKISYL